MTEEIKKTPVRGRVKATPAVEPVVENTENADNKVAETVVTPEPVIEKRQLQDADRILVMNNGNGMYGYHTGGTYSVELESYGQTIGMPLSELRIMAAGQHRKHLTEGWIIILDEDVVEELSLTHQYKYIYTQDKIDKLFTKPDTIEEVFPKMSKAMKTTFVLRARQLVKEDALTDFRVIRTISELSKVDITE